jgi:hypothetical protein
MSKPIDLSSLTSQQMSAIEADTYYCLTAILNQILDNYT